jgi:hypothetical protein
MGKQHFFGEFESGNGLCSGYSGEMGKELIKRCPFSKIIKQRLDWHAGADEHRRAA